MVIKSLVHAFLLGSRLKRGALALPVLATCCLVQSTAVGSDLRILGPTHFGQLGQGDINYIGTLTSLETGVSQASVGYSHVMYIDTDGTLWGFGDNSRGQLGDGTFTFRRDPVEIAQDVAHVDAGYYSTFYVKTDGSLYAMGSPGNGLWGGQQTPTATPRRLLSSGVEKAVLGESHAAFLLENGDLLGTGISVYLGGGSTQIVGDPVKLATGVADVAVTNSGIFYLRDDGALYGIGYSIPGTEETITPFNQPIGVATGVAAFDAGEDAVLYVNGSGQLYSFGIGENGALGLGRDHKTVSSPMLVASDVEQVTTDGETSFFIDTQDQLWGFGLNLYGQLGNGTFRDRYTPQLVTSGVASVSTKRTVSMVVTTAGDLRGAGNIALLQMDPHESEPWPVKIASGVARTFAGFQTVFYLLDNGDLWGMGRNEKGQLGAGDFGHKGTAQFIANDVVDVDAGDTHTVYLTASGDMFVTGDNAESQLGDEDDEIATPVKFPLADTVEDVEIAADATLWIDAVAHSLWLVADPENEEYFHESESVTIPFRVSQNVIDVGADEAIFYVTSGNELWVRGKSLVERLSKAGVREPAANGTLRLDTNVADVESANGYAVYRKTDGSLWGIGEFGGFGPLSDPFHQDPTHIDDTVAKVRASEHGVLYQKDDGTLWLRAADATSASRLGYQSTEVTPGESLQMWPSAVVHDFAINEFNIAVVTDSPAAPALQGVDTSASSVLVGEGSLLTLSTNEQVVNVEWFRGAVGDESNPMSGSGLLERRVYPYSDTSYWARVSNEVGEVSVTETFSVTVQNPEYGAWAQERGLSGPDGLHTADADGDAVANGLEYAFGMHPLVQDPVAPALLYDEDERTFSFLHPNSADAEVTLSYQHSEDLENWSDVEAGRIQQLENNLSLIEWSEEELAKPGFVRVVVSDID